QVTLAKVVGRNRFAHRLHEVVDRMLEWQAINLAGVVKTPHVLAGAEDRAAGRTLVATHSFEDARRVMNDMAHHVYRRVFPIHELAVPPDLARTSRLRCGHP